MTGTAGPGGDDARHRTPRWAGGWTRRWPGQLAVAAAIFLVLDAVWILAVAGPLYRATMPELLRDPFAPLPALAFYVLFVAVLIHLAVRPTTNGGRSVREATLTGGLVGLTAYATFALTSLAVIEGFAVPAALADLVWGAVVGATVCGLSALALLRLDH